MYTFIFLHQYWYCYLLLLFFRFLWVPWIYKGLSDWLKGPSDMLQVYLFHSQYFVSWGSLSAFSVPIWTGCVLLRTLFTFFGCLSLLVSLIPSSLPHWQGTFSRTVVLKLFGFRTLLYSCKLLRPPKSFHKSEWYL